MFCLTLFGHSFLFGLAWQILFESKNPLIFRQWELKRVRCMSSTCSRNKRSSIWPADGHIANVCEWMPNFLCWWLIELVFINGATGCRKIWCKYWNGIRILLVLLLTLTWCVHALQICCGNNSYHAVEQKRRNKGHIRLTLLTVIWWQLYLVLLQGLFSFGMDF